jgi:hypothetical protein
MHCCTPSNFPFGQSDSVQQCICGHVKDSRFEKKNRRFATTFFFKSSALPRRRCGTVTHKLKKANAKNIDLNTDNGIFK